MSGWRRVGMGEWDWLHRRVAPGHSADDPQPTR